MVQRDEVGFGERASEQDSGVWLHAEGIDAQAAAVKQQMLEALQQRPGLDIRSERSLGNVKEGRNDPCPCGPTAP